MVLQVGDTRRPTLLVSAYDADTVVALTIVMPGATTGSLLSMTGPVPQGGGVGLWTASASYTLSLPGTWRERFVVTNAVSGLGAGSAWVDVDVESTPPVVPAGAWATAAQFMAQIGGAPPDNLAFKLWRATLQLRPYVAGALYRTDDADVIAAKVTACCLQVAYAAENGWTTGAPTLVQAGQIGSLRIDAPKRNDGSSTSTALPPISPEAAEILEAAGLLYAAPATDLTWGAWW